MVDEYSLTHPVSQKRIDYIKANLSAFNNVKKTGPAELVAMKYVVVKLQAFLSDSDKALKYFNSNSSFDKYARSVIYFKKGEVKKSITEIDDLIKTEPKNGYFHELKGQILFENGFVKESIKSYKKALEILPNDDLIKIALSASVLALKTDDRELVNFAIKNLNEAKIHEKTNGQIFQELSKAYLKIKEDGKSYLALSELNLLKQDNKKAREYAKMALEKLPKDDKINQLKANDILTIVKEDDKDPNLEH